MRVLRALVISAALSVVGPGNADAGHAAAAHPDLDQLIERFNADAPQHEGSVQLDAWIENEADRDVAVIVVAPQGAFKLVADPGITVTPIEQAGVEWLVPLPYRHVDLEIPYFTPSASMRLPFRATHDQPLQVMVEYAYCVVDYQCFFGEQALTIAARDD